MEKLQKRLPLARESHALAKGIGDEDREKLKSSACLKLEEGIELKMEQSTMRLNFVFCVCDFFCKHACF